MPITTFQFTRPINLQNIEDVAQWAEAVLTEIESAFNAQRRTLELVTLYAEPEKLYDGLIALADGTSWDPGSGAGVYRYASPSWVLLG